MKFLMIIKHKEHTDAFVPPQSLMDAMGELVTEGFTKKWLKDTAGLKPTRDAVRIRLKNGKLSTTDGPFTESKEVIGGYAIIEAATREDGLQLADRFMELHRVHVPDFECECEVRPCEDV